MATNIDSSGCYACDLTSGVERLIGGSIYTTPRWAVEHCMGPLGVGTLIVKPQRHVLHVWELSEPELQEMGPLIGKSARIIKQITNCDQVYVCLWSHGAFEPVHVHYVVQPVSNTLRSQYEHAGPSLQVEMFRQGNVPNVALVEAFCEQARKEFQNDA